MKTTNGNKNMGAALALGCGVGAALGVALGNVAIGVAMGVAIGVALGASGAFSEIRQILSDFFFKSSIDRETTISQRVDPSSRRCLFGTVVKRSVIFMLSR